MKQPRYLLLHCDELDIWLDALQSDEFPTIDIDSFLTGALEGLNAYKGQNLEYILSALVNTDYLTGKLSWRDESTLKLESIVYQILTMLQSTLTDVQLYNADVVEYEYKSRRSENVLLLEWL